MQNTDVLIIGGGPSGIVSSLCGKSHYPDKDFTIIRKEKQVVVPCGIPYIFNTLNSIEKNLISDKPLKDNNINLVIDEVIKLELDNKIAYTKEGREIKFEKLILATGSKPNIIPIKGSELENVFHIYKTKKELQNLIQKLENINKIAIIGGGFIGVEVGDELAKKGKKITIIEIQDTILPAAFDKDIAKIAEEKIKSIGIEVLTKVGVKEIKGKDGKVKEILLDNGKTIDTEAVIIATGYIPNTKLAKESGISTNEYGFIKVDEYMRTNKKDVFAVGDCAEKRDFTTRKIERAMLASIAYTEARVAGANLYKLSIVKTFSGTISIFSTKIADTGFATAGLTEQMAKKEGFEIITATFEGKDKHPATLPETHNQLVKLIASKETGILLGGEIVAGQTTGELINIIGLAIQNRMTLNDLMFMQIGTHPLLTAPPTAYPIIKAAQMLEKKRK